MTGASRGIGRATAELLARGGCARLLLLGGRDPNALADAAAAVERAATAAGHPLPAVHCAPCDVRSCAEVADAFAAGARALGGPPLSLVAAAGVASEQLFIRASQDSLQTVLETNLLGAMHIAREFLRAVARTQRPPRMDANMDVGMDEDKEEERMLPSIVFVGSVVGVPYARRTGLAGYAASKAGLLGLARALAAEYGPRGVRVNVVQPGVIATDMTANMLSSLEKRAGIVAETPLRRVGRPEDVAGAVEYLLRAPFVTGAALVVDGGLSL